MTTQLEKQSSRERSWIYITAVVLLVALGIWAVLAFSSGRQNQQAEDKADELIAALGESGLGSPEKDDIVRVLGDDGGSTCADPNKALSRATLLAMLTNGATGPGARPVIADSRAIRGQLLIIDIYCPDELNEFEKYVDDLKTDDLMR